MELIDKLKEAIRLRHVHGTDLLESPRTKIAHIEFTSRCNLRCVFCAVSQPDYNGSDIDPETMEDIISSLKSRYVNVVSVNGHGETTIYKNWHRHCNKMLDAGMPLHVISNFSKELSHDELKTLSKFKSIEISCDSNDPKLFKQLRRGADLRTLCLNIIRLRAIAAGNGQPPPGISFSCVVSDQNVLDLMEYVIFGKTLGVTHFNFCNLTKYPEIPGALNPNHITEMPRKQLEKARDTLTRVFQFLHRSHIKFHFQQGLLDSLNEKIRRIHAPAPPVSQNPAHAAAGKTLPHPHHYQRYSSTRPALQTRDCLDPWQFVLVRADKNVLPCCWHSPIGSLGGGQSLAGVFNNTPNKELRNHLLSGDLSPDCSNCPSRGWTTTETLKEKVWHYLNPGINKLRFRKIPPIKVPVLNPLGLVYQKGWYPAETDGNIDNPDCQNWRWTNGRAICQLEKPERDALLTVRGQVNKAVVKNQGITIKLNDTLLDHFTPGTSFFFREFVIQPQMTRSAGTLFLTLETDKTFIPSALDSGTGDNRVLGMQIHHLFFGEKS
ncbi:MAG: radical SAM protein [bacterium]|nr:radical SAM protein [bacterium]